LVDDIYGRTRCITLASRCYGDSFVLAWVCDNNTVGGGEFEHGTSDDVNSSLVVDVEREIQQLTILYNSYAREWSIVLLQLLQNG